MISSPISRTSSFSFLLMAVMLCGCATTGTATLRSGQILTPQDWEHLEVVTAYDAVAKLHPRWIESQADDASVAVFLDGGHLGNATALRLVELQELSEIRFEPGHQAVNSLGPGFAAGAIHLRSRS